MILKKGTQFIWENARHLERAIFAYRFDNGPATRILQILRSYQNADGGFGHALEPDLRAPDSHPLFVEFALHTLYECNLRDVALASKVCDFLAQHADLQQGVPTIFPSARHFPRAAHWNNPAAEAPSFDRLTGLVGLLHWQGVQHPWLQTAVDACLTHVATAHYTDAHTILTAFCLLESLALQTDVNELFTKLAQELWVANFFWLETPVKGYGLTPLHFAPTPDAYCRRLFSDAQIAAHLQELAAQQEADGGWPIAWEAPSEMARCEWRAHRTVNALTTLRAYGSIEAP